MSATKEAVVDFFANAVEGGNAIIVVFGRSVTLNRLMALLTFNV